MIFFSLHRRNILIYSNVVLNLDTSIREFHCLGILGRTMGLDRCRKQLGRKDHGAIQPSKEQGETVESVSYHIRSYWRTSLHLENGFQLQGWP